MMKNEHLNKLDPMRRMFVLEYLKDFKASNAAERAGAAKSSGTKLVGELEIQEAIAEQMAERAMRMQIDADWVLHQLGAMWDANLSDLFYPGTNDLRPIHEWPDIWQKMATSVKVTALYEGRGEDRVLIGYTKDIKILDRQKTLEMIGKHTDVRAFTERVEVSTDDALTKRLIAGRKRAQNRNSSSDEPSFM